MVEVQQIYEPKFYTEWECNIHYATCNVTKLAQQAALRVLYKMVHSSLYDRNIYHIYLSTLTLILITINKWYYIYFVIRMAVS